MGSLSFLQWIFLTEELNQGLLHCRQILYQLSYQGSSSNIHWIIEKAKELWKNIYFYFIDYAKTFDCVDHNKLWKIHKEMGMPDHLKCVLRNPYAGKEATVRTGHGTTDWFKIGRWVQVCILSNCLFNSYAEWVKLQNSRLDELQAGNEIARRNINNLRYAYNTTLMAGSKEELKSLFCEGEKGEWKSWFKNQH